jgi:hypothetical protein
MRVKCEVCVRERAVGDANGFLCIRLAEPEKWDLLHRPQRSLGTAFDCRHNPRSPHGLSI